MKSSGLNSRTSWTVTVACGIICFLTMMPAKLSGLLFVEIISRYKTSRELASYPVFLCMFVMCSGGPFTGYFGARFGINPVILAGCALSALGVGACFFAKDIATVIVFMGLVYGFGISFSRTLIPQVLKQYFDKNLTLAIAVSQSGPSLGAFIIPPVITWFFEIYGVSGTFLLMAAIILHSVPIAMFLKALEPRKGGNNSHVHAKQNDCKSTEESIPANYLDDSTSSNMPPNMREERQSNTKINEDNRVWELQDKHREKTQIFLTSTSTTRTTQDEKCRQNPNNREALRNEPETNSTLIEKHLIANSVCNESNKLHHNNRYETTTVLFNNSKPCASFQNQKEAPSQTFENDEETLEQSMKLLADSHETVKDINEVRFGKETVTKLEDKKPVSKQKAALQSLSIFLDPTFWIILVTQSFQVLIMVLVVTTMIDYSRDKGIARNKEVYFLMFLPLAELIGRLVLAKITDRNYLTKVNLTVILFFVTGLICTFMVWTDAFYAMMISVVLFGAVSCGIIAVAPMIIFEFIEPKNYTMALASRLFLYGPMSFLSAPLIGYFRGTLGSYNWVYYILSMMAVFCGILTAFLPYFTKRRQRKEEKRRNIENSNCSENI